MSAVARAPRAFLVRVAAMGVGELVAKVAVTLAFVRLARVLEPSAYGQAEWALSWLMVGWIAADAGLGTWAASQLGARPEQAPHLAAQVGRVRLRLSAFVALLLVLVSRASAPDAGAALGVYALALLLTPWIVPYLFNGLLRSEWAGLASAARGVVFALATVVLAAPGAKAVSVARAEVLGAVAAALCCVLAARYALGIRLPLGGARVDARSLLARSWPIGASELTWGALWYAGLLLLGYVATAEDTAWYGAALRLVMALHTLVFLYLYVLLPTLSHALAADPALWRVTLERSVRLTTWGGGLIALVGTLGARPILAAVFGPAFEAATPLLRILVWVVPVSWASGHLRYSFIASNQPSYDSRAALVGAAAALVLSLALAPALRSRGAALGLLGGVVANALAAGWFAHRVLPHVRAAASAMPATVVTAVCLVLGAILVPLAGDMLATLSAAALLMATALVIERHQWRPLLTHADR